MNTPLSRQMDQMADAQEWKERAEAAEAEVERLQKMCCVCEGDCCRLAKERLAEVERLRGALGDIETAKDGVCDSGYSAGYVARAALRGGGE